MVRRIKNWNLIFGILFTVGLSGSVLEFYKINSISEVNRRISSGELIKDDGYPYLQKFTAAYDQGNHTDFKHAVQTYGQILDTSPSPEEQARIHYNIGNNLFMFGLIRRINDDGTLQDEARYAYTQAKMAYEQSLRIEPHNRLAKFNLNLLLSVMANKMRPAPKDQSTMELSNLPVGLP